MNPAPIDPPGVMTFYLVAYEEYRDWRAAAGAYRQDLLVMSQQGYVQ
jgi:hypothetical protein